MKNGWFYCATIVAIIALMIVAHACQKDAQSAANDPKTDGMENPEPNPYARGSGIETLYSVDSNGTYFKMELVWNTTTGAVTVDRSVVTSGYPAGLQQSNIIDPSISVIKIDLDSDTLSFDTLICNLDIDKTYFIIKFDPSFPNPSESHNSGYGYNLFCSCTKAGSGSSWTLRSGTVPRSYYCQGCSKCGIFARYDDSDGPGGSSSDAITSGGIYFVEATSVTILH